MADFVLDGALGSNQSKSSGGTVVITTGAVAEVGKVITVRSAWDNTDTADGDTTRLSCTDSAGNTYTRVRERTESAGAAEDGATVALFVTTVTSELASGGTITVTSGTNRVAKAAAAEKWTKVAGTLTVEQAVTQQDHDGTPGNYSEISLVSLPSREYLVLWAAGQENNNSVTVTQDADYTALTKNGTTGGGAASNMYVAGGYRIATLTADTVDASASSAVGAQVQILAAFYVAAGGTEHFGAASLDLTAGVDTLGRKDAKAAAAVDLTAGIVAVGRKDAHAAAVLPVVFDAVTTATKTAHAAVSLPVTLSVETVGRKVAYGSNVLPIVLTIDTEGDTAVTGAASLEVTFGAVVTGSRTAHGAAALPVTVTIGTAGMARAYGSATLPVAFTVTASATRRAYATVDLPITVTIATRGDLPAPVPNMDAILTGWIALPAAGIAGHGVTGRIRTPDTGSIT